MMLQKHFFSGTSGNSTSKIFLDKENTKNQIIVLKNNDKLSWFREIANADRRQ